MLTLYLSEFFVFILFFLFVVVTVCFLLWRKFYLSRTWVSVAYVSTSLRYCWELQPPRDFSQGIKAPPAFKQNHPTGGRSTRQSQPKLTNKVTKCHRASHLGDFRSTCSGTKHSNHFLPPQISSFIFFFQRCFLSASIQMNVISTECSWASLKKNCLGHNWEMIYRQTIFFFFVATYFHTYSWHGRFQKCIW